jgi:hypothetical protein
VAQERGLTHRSNWHGTQLGCTVTPSTGNQRGSSKGERHPQRLCRNDGPRLQSQSRRDFRRVPSSLTPLSSIPARVAMRAQAERHEPIWYIINPEHHVDHIFGTYFFKGAGTALSCTTRAGSTTS